MLSISSTDTFPTLSIPSRNGGLPVEVTLISQLGHGAGSQLVQTVSRRQASHAKFVDELDEPSTKLGGADFKRGDATSLYSFAVGENGHPFHCHAGHRVFTAISGSTGAQLRFSMTTAAQMTLKPAAFIDGLHFVNVPPDCLFTVRFAGGVWHQFVPLQTHCGHPALFAISCHTNELGGIDDEELQHQIMKDDATIPGLTQLLPDAVQSLLSSGALDEARIPTTTLSLGSPSASITHRLCNSFRANLGAWRTTMAKWCSGKGFTTVRIVKNALRGSLPKNSLLATQLQSAALLHEDYFSINVNVNCLPSANAAELLEKLLEAFVQRPAKGVSLLMAVRNTLVKPAGLRTAALGCPVSSLLSEQKENLFAGRFPVLAQRVNQTANSAEVILGATDKHLIFRSAVGVKLLNDGDISFSLATRVWQQNIFGKLYMALIKAVHLRYVTPTMLEQAVKQVVLHPNYAISDAV